MAHVSAWLRSVPRGESVRAEARVYHGQVSFITRVLQIWVEREKLSGREHPFINNGFRGQTARIDHAGFIDILIISEDGGELFSNNV